MLSVEEFFSSWKADYVHISYGLGWSAFPYFVFCPLTLLHGARGRKAAEPGVCGVPAAAEGCVGWAGGQAALLGQWPERAQQGGERPAAGQGNSPLINEVRKLLHCCHPLSSCLVFSGVANTAQRSVSVEPTFGGGFAGLSGCWGLGISEPAKLHCAPGRDMACPGQKAPSGQAQAWLWCGSGRGSSQGRERQITASGFPYNCSSAAEERVLLLRRLFGHLCCITLLYHSSLTTLCTMKLWMYLHLYVSVYILYG